jgi:hypothetical protein
LPARSWREETPVRVDLAADVFDGVERLPDLLALLRCFVVGRHDWVVTDPAVITAAQRYLGEHVPTSSESYVELARKGTVAAAWRGGASVATVVRVTGAELEDLATDLEQPAVLVVENGTSDGCFVHGLVLVFKAADVQRALAERWLLVEHGGGETLVEVVRSKVCLYRRQVRVAAILDSDRMLPGERTRAHDKAERLRERGVAVWVLTLREAENYVPNRVLGSIGRPSEASRKLNLLKRLTPEQRGHFDMKAGFGVPDRPPNVHPSVGRYIELFVRASSILIISMPE